MSEPKMDYPLAFLREIDGVTKDEILKAFIEAPFDDAVDLETIPNEKLRTAWIRLMMEAEQASDTMNDKLNQTLSAAAKENRATRRKKTADERAKDAGLVTLRPNIPDGKLILK